jgi:hypothetical protein
MARPRTIIHVPPREAAFILEALMRDGRIDSKTVGEYRARYVEEIASLETRLAHLRQLSGADVVAPLATADAAPAVLRTPKRVGRPRAARAGKRAVNAAANASPERVKSRELQGKYLGLMRQIPRTVVKQRFGKTAIATKGKEAILAEMEKYVSGRKKAKR